MYVCSREAETAIDVRRCGCMYRCGAIEMLVMQRGSCIEGIGVVAGSIFKLDMGLEGRRNLERDRALDCNKLACLLPLREGIPRRGALPSSFNRNFDSVHYK